MTNNTIIFEKDYTQKEEVYYNNIKGLAAQMQENKDEEWSERDKLPTGDPIGDIDDSSHIVPLDKDEIAKLQGSYNKDQQTYFEMMRERLLVPQGKYMGVDVAQCCDHPDKYKNIISRSLKFWSCRNCGADLGDIK